MSPEWGRYDQAKADADIAVHAADIDAHQSDPWLILRTGEYHQVSPHSDPSGSRTLVLNTIYAIPLHVSRKMTLDRLGFNVSTLAALASARVGIYNNGTNLYPGTLVKDVGTASVASTGVKEVTITDNQQLTPGLYWLVIVSDGGPILGGMYVSYSVLGLGAAAFGRQHGWSATLTYGALPASFPSTGATILTAQPPAIWPRLLSLD